MKRLVPLALGLILLSPLAQAGDAYDRIAHVFTSNPEFISSLNREMTEDSSPDDRALTQCLSSNITARLPSIISGTFKTHLSLGDADKIADFLGSPAGNRLFTSALAGKPIDMSSLSHQDLLEIVTFIQTHPGVDTAFQHFQQVQSDMMQTMQKETVKQGMQIALTECSQFIGK